jgi:hypothetical protein
MAEGLSKVAKGEIPENVINHDVLARSGFRAKLERFAENRVTHP